MKSSLVFALIAVFLSLKNIEAEKCLPVPVSFMKYMRHCFATLNKEDQELYIKNEEPDKREFKCFHLCLLKKMGYYKDGEFFVEKMGEIARKYMPTKKLAEALIARNEDSMLKAIVRTNDDCGTAHEYFKIMEGKEKEEPLITKIFCSNGEEDEGMKMEKRENNNSSFSIKL